MGILDSKCTESSAYTSSKEVTSDTNDTVHVPVTAAVYGYPEQGLTEIGMLREYLLREYLLAKAPQLQ